MSEETREAKLARKEQRRLEKEAAKEERAHVRRILRETESLREQMKMLRKSNRRLNRLVAAMVRGQHLDLAGGLGARRFRLYSQNEEDGIVLALLSEVKASQKTFVEIGCGTNGGNSGFLAAELEWRGLMIDMMPENTEETANKFRHNPALSTLATAVTPDNINAIIGEYDLVDPDFFSLDIDSYDYFVFEVLESRPMVISLEYNYRFGLHSITVPMDGIPEDAPNGYHGASLKALTRLAARKGYRLVHVERAGVNAFYVREDLVPELPTLDVDKAYLKWSLDEEVTSDGGNPIVDQRADYEAAGLKFVEIQG